MKANNEARLTESDRSRETQRREFQLRELTYHYQVKKGVDGRPVTLGLQIMRARDAWLATQPFLEDEAVEVLGVLCLTTKHRVICWHELSRGCLDASLGHPRELFKVACLCNAAAVVILHNHPSGEPTPSSDDVASTRRFAAAGELLGIPVLDHVVIGDRCFASLKELGYL